MGEMTGGTARLWGNDGGSCGREGLVGPVSKRAPQVGIKKKVRTDMKRKQSTYCNCPARGAGCRVK